MLKLMSKEKSFVFWADTPEEKTLWASKFEAAEKSRAQMMNRTLGPGIISSRTLSSTNSLIIFLSAESEGKSGSHDEFAALWQNDGESAVCPLCMIKFTTLRRKVPWLIG